MTTSLPDLSPVPHLSQRLLFPLPIFERRFPPVRARVIFLRKSKIRRPRRRSYQPLGRPFQTRQAQFRRQQIDQARDEFDKAVDIVLESGMDVRVSQRLQTFISNSLNESTAKKYPRNKP
jgi:hypothetical protein